MEDNMKICYTKYMKRMEDFPWTEKDKRQVIELIYGLIQAVYDKEIENRNAGGV